MINTRIMFLLVVMLGVAYLAFFAPEDGLDTAITRTTSVFWSSQQGDRDTPSKVTLQNKETLALKPIKNNLLKDRQELLSPLLERKSPSSLFQTHTWVVPVKPPPPVPVIPAAPPNPFKFLGKQQSGNDIKVFLAEGDKTWVAEPNSVLGTLYKVESIKPPKLTIVYLPLNIRQDIYIGNFE
jgi:hypothetical protein